MHSRWFKSVICMRYTSSEKVSQANWEPKLKKLQHRPIKPAEKISVGFSPVFGYISPNMMSHELQNFFYVSLTIEEKKLPKNKIRNLVEMRIRELAKQEGKKPEDISKDVRKSIETNIESGMLKDIVPDELYINAFFDTQKEFLFVDVSSEAKVETLIDFINKFDSSFEATKLFEASLEVYLTRWLYDPAGNMPNGIQLDTEATLKNGKDAKAVFTKQDLGSDEIITLINHDKKASELALKREHGLHFKLKSDGSIRKVKVPERTDRSSGSGSLIEDREADWILMSNEITNLYQWFETIFEVNASSSDGAIDGVIEQVSNAASTAPQSAIDLENDSVAELSTLSFG